MTASGRAHVATLSRRKAKQVLTPRLHRIAEHRRQHRNIGPIVGRAGDFGSGITLNAGICRAQLIAALS
jgi:hypothetical protein